MTATISQRISKLERLAASTNHPGERRACLKRIEALKKRQGTTAESVSSKRVRIRTSDPFASASAAAREAGSQFKHTEDALHAFIDLFAIAMIYSMDDGFKRWCERKGIDFYSMRKGNPSRVKKLFEEYQTEKEL